MNQLKWNRSHNKVSVSKDERYQVFPSWFNDQGHYTAYYTVGEGEIIGTEYPTMKEAKEAANMHNHDLHLDHIESKTFGN